MVGRDHQNTLFNPFLPKLFHKTTEKPQEMIFYGLCDLCAIREDPTH